MELTETDLTDLKKAKNLLENTGLAMKLANFMGLPLDKMLGNLPDSWSRKTIDIIQAALQKAADAAIFTMKDEPGKKSSDKWHKLSVAVAGGLGGMFGIGALSVELPVTTTIMLRSIVDIARSEGEDIKTMESKMACLEVFALGGPSTDDDDAGIGYYSVRAGLAVTARKGLQEKGASMVAKFIAAIAKRFGGTVAQKLSAQAVPIVGGAGGAIINTIFMDHYQDMARGHFIIRRLERQYGKETIEALYKTV